MSAPQKWTAHDLAGGGWCVEAADGRRIVVSDYGSGEGAEALAALLTAAEAAVYYLDSGESKAEVFERVAEEFRRQTGMLAPGKSYPMEMGAPHNDRKREDGWTEFLDARCLNLAASLRAAIAKAKGDCR